MWNVFWFLVGLSILFVIWLVKCVIIVVVRFSGVIIRFCVGVLVVGIRL